VLFAARSSGRRRGNRLELRIDLLTRNCAQNAGHDDASVRLEPALDHAQVADFRTDGDLALLDHVVLVEHEQVASTLIRAERGVGHQ
jgi:hypothetical protein